MHVLDLLFSLAARGPRFFADGWGDRSLRESMEPEFFLRLASRHADYDVTASLGRLQTPTMVVQVWPSLGT